MPWPRKNGPKAGKTEAQMEQEFARKPMTTEGRIEEALHNATVDAVQHGRDSVTVTFIRADAMILHTRLRKILSR